MHNAHNYTLYYPRPQVPQSYCAALNPGSLSWGGGKGEPGTHCVNVSVKQSGYYQRTRGLCMYTAMSGENTETK